MFYFDVWVCNRCKLIVRQVKISVMKSLLVNISKHSWKMWISTVIIEEKKWLDYKWGKINESNAIHSWKTGKVRTLVDQQKLKETNRAQTFKISIIDCQLALMNYQKMCLVIVELHPCITNQRARPVRRGLDISWFLFLPTINAPYT